MPIADWSVDFNLRSRVWATGSQLLPFNQTVIFPSGEGTYLLRQDGCKLSTPGDAVRAQKENVPEADGSILHCRYVAGMEMQLAIQLWEKDRDRPACDELLQEMLDELMGYLFNLINAGDDDGRISWTPKGENTRMLDDIRLLTYPSESHPPSGIMEIGVTLDCALPYSEDELQLAPTIPGDVVNGGNRPTYPVWKVFGPTTYFTIENTDTGESFSWDGAAPGMPVIGPTDYLEINTFDNTVFKNAIGSNLMGGIVMSISEFFLIPPGTSAISLSSGGAASVGLINAAWA